ncbi:MAG: glycosyltransferase [Geodermatophilaceae bacterium]|nr:glycosyltransferase [Geodermatophilaceae bacterium]
METSVVVAVVVTWNRAELLARSLSAILGQTRPPDRVLVVDNASTDETATMLAQRFADRVDVIRLADNLGGAGGFAAGIVRALEHDPVGVWLMDDDTVPELTALQALLETREHYLGPPPAILASRVVWIDGRDHPMNTPRAKPGAGRGERLAARAVGGTPIRSASFVSILCSAEVLRERGLPEVDYFLWNDDFEFTTRLLRGRRGLLCPASVVKHHTKTFGNTDADPGDRFYFEVRNKIWMFTRGTGLNAAERILYAGSTGRRWIRTVAGSKDRQRLLRAARGGLLAGLRAGPRPSGELLAAALPLRPSVQSGPRAGSQPVRERFSLLIAIYARDRPEFFAQAFTSTINDQTRRPDEVVVVQDGPIPSELARCLAALTAASPVPVVHVVLPDNLGLGPALVAGLAHCTYDVVARMDADDVSEPTRFAAQLPLLEAGADIVGTGLREFVHDPGDPADVLGTRTPPTDPRHISRAARFHDPFNHPTVVYRRRAVLAAGGYQDLPLMEDYLLFARMLAAGARPANLAEPLVNYRVGEGAYARRGGLRLLRSEFCLQRRLRRLGFTTPLQYGRNLVVRGGYRLVPVTLRRLAYRAVIANRQK